jgi:hypothetical protein
MAIDHLVQPFELFGMGLAACLAPQHATFLDKGLFDCCAGTLGQAGELLAGHLGC